MKRPSNNWSIFNHYVSNPDLLLCCSRHGSTVSRRRYAACFLQLLIWQLTYCGCSFLFHYSLHNFKMTLIVSRVLFMINVNTSFATEMLLKWNCSGRKCSVCISNDLIQHFSRNSVTDTQFMPIYKHCNTFFSCSWAQSPFCYLIRWYSR